MAEKGIIKNTDIIIKNKNINKKKNMIQQVEFSLRPLPRGFHAFLLDFPDHSPINRRSIMQS